MPKRATNGRIDQLERQASEISVPLPGDVKLVWILNADGIPIKGGLGSDRVDPLEPDDMRLAMAESVRTNSPIVLMADLGQTPEPRPEGWYDKRKIEIRHSLSAHLAELLAEFPSVRIALMW